MKSLTTMKLHVFVAFIMLTATVAFSQNPAFEVTSTSGGFVAPSMTTAQRTSISSPVLGSLVYDNTLSAYYLWNGAWVPLVTGTSVSFANPSASIGLSAVNGSATTVMRSDAAPALSVAITPSWSGLHTYTGGITTTGTSTLSLGADASANTINVGTGGAAKTVSLGSVNTTSTTTINSGTGGLSMNTGAATNAITTLGTTGSQVFGSSTTGADKIAIKPQSTTTTNAFTGTVTSADLTAARTWTLPDETGTLLTAGVLSGVTVYTTGTAATYTVPAGVTRLLVKMVGGGGAGGSANFASCAGSNHSGAGGGAGGYCEGFISSPATSYLYTVGAGGTASATTCGVSSGQGGNGGATTFGASLYTANGGTGGRNSSNGLSFVGGAGGSASGATINIPGGRGGIAVSTTNWIAGDGANSYFGQGGTASQWFVTGNIAGQAGQAYGSGGSGAIANTTSQLGGNGASGIIIIYEFK